MGFLGVIRNLIGTFETKIQDSVYKSTGGDEEATKAAMSLLKGMILDEFVSDKNIDDVVYHMGASVKDMGKSLCAVTKMNITPQEIIDNVTK
jgi:hypothetical protein